MKPLRKLDPDEITSEAEDLLKDIEDMKRKEDEKIESWKNNLQKLKEKLGVIDQNLFEV